MKQILLPATISNERSYVLSGQDYHHLVRVLRCKTGDRIAVTDKSGKSFIARLGHIDRSGVKLELEGDAILPEEKTGIVLIQALPKGKKMELIVRQAVEAGISGIIPVISRYSLVRFDNDNDAEKKRERWTSIAREAFMQSGSPSFPVIERPVKLSDIALRDNGLKLVFHQEQSDSQPLHSCLCNDYQIVYILIGPEGGFSNDEIRYLKERGFIPVYLGKNILRVETAAIYSIAAVRIILDERKIWRRESSSQKECPS